jgi:hypothetical protein
MSSVRDAQAAASGFALAFSCKSGHAVGMTDDPRKTRERIETLLRKALTLTQKLPLSESVQEAAAPYDPASSHYRVARYPYSRFYALYDGEELLAVTVYKKGAEAVRDRLQAQEARIAALTQEQRDQSEADPAAPGAVARREKERGSGKVRQR